MSDQTVHTLLCIVSVALCLTGLGLILANMFFASGNEYLPYGLGCIILGNLFNVVRGVLQKNIK